MKPFINYHKAILAVIFISFFSKVISQEYFIKFSNSVTKEEIEDFKRQIITSSNSKFYCPFKSQSEKLQKTYVLAGVNLNQNTFQAIQEYAFIDYIEKVPEYDFFYTPNDLGSGQWNLSQINAELAWNETTGANVPIAIVDNAVQISHVDLSSNIYINPNEIAGNGIDDDNNGYIDDVTGWDAADNDNDPSPPANANASYFSHGTHCAGISAAVTDNGIGISSIGFNSKIIPVKIANNSTGTLSGAYFGVDYAIIAGAKIISMSWGGGMYSITYQNLFDYAYSQGIVCIAAAGNNNVSSPMYPASYNHVISVGATDQLDQKAPFSNYGSTIDVMAPGVGIYSTVPQNGYDYKSGTSMACPLVSGLAALMLAKNPSLTPDELEACLKNSCDNIDALNPNYMGSIGSGRINALAALQCLKPITANFTSDLNFVCPGNTVQYTDLSNNNPTSWTWTFSGGTPGSSTLQNPLVQYNTSGQYDVQLVVTNANGSDTIVYTNYVDVNSPTATMSGNSTILPNSTTLITVSFTGNPPWSFTYTDGTNSTTVNNITYSPYQIPVSPQTTTTYSLVSMSDAHCNGSVSGNAVVNIVQAGGGCGTNASSTFRKLFEGTGTDMPSAVTATQDGGMIMLGRTTTSSAGGTDYLVIKMDQNGVVQWQKTYGNSNDQLSAKSQIIQDTDGNYVIASHQDNGGASWYPQVIKLDPNGNIIWTRTLNANNNMYHYFRDVIQTSDGGYLCSGTASQIIASSDFLFVKFDNNGNILWTKVMGKGANDHAIKTLELSNGNILVAGTSEISSSNRNAVITMYDANMNIIWNYAYSFSNGKDIFFHVEEKPNGNFIASGHNDGFSSLDIIVSEFDLNGNVIWSKSLGGSYTDVCTGIHPMPDGTVLLSGLKETSAGVYNIILCSFDGGGNIIWSKEYPTNSGYFNIAYGGNELEVLDVVNGNQPVLSGVVLGQSTGQDIVLMKTDPCGNIGCGELSNTVSQVNRNITRSSITYSSSLFGSEIPVSITSQNLLLTDSTICQSIASPVSCGVTADFKFELDCAGNITHFYDSSIDTIGTITYWEWHFGDGDSLTGTSTPTHVYLSGGTYNVQLVVGSDSSCFDTITKSVTIPNSLTVLMSDTTICINDSVTIQPTIYCGTAPYTVSWSPSTGLSDPAILNPVASPASTTTYQLSITDNNGNSTTSSVTVTVDNNCCKSYPGFNIPNQICLGDTIFTINTSIVTGNPNYNWQFGNSATPDSFVGETPTGILYDSIGNFPVTLFLTDNCGQDSIVKNIAVNPLPVVNVISDTLLCVSDTILLGDTAIGNLMYNWTQGTLVSDSTSSNPFYYATGSNTFYLKVTDPYTGCSNIDSVNILLFDTIINIGTDTTICPGQQITINSGVIAESYLWSTGDTTSSIIVGDSNSYWVVANQGSCSKSDTILVSVYSTPLDLGPDTVLCAGDTLLLNPAISNVSYTWQDGSVDSVYYVTDSGNYSVSITYNSCVFSDSINVVYNQLPYFNLGNDTLICENTNFMIGVEQQQYYQYYWQPNGDTTSTIAVSDSGIYKLTVINNCGSDSSQITIRIEHCDCIFVVPNIFTPNGDGKNETFRIRGELENCLFESLTIYNRWGEKLFETEMIGQGWDGYTDQEGKAPEGTYFYIIQVNGEVYKGTVMLIR